MPKKQPMKQFREWGRRGGIASRDGSTQAQRTARARKAAKARWSKR